MRLRYVYISHYKNLKNFSFSFDGSTSVDVFVGKNGSGKSNLFEALIEIFRHLDQLGQANNDINFEYNLLYDIGGKNIDIEWKEKKLRINQEEGRATLGKIAFPDNILVYYSGHNPTVSNLVGDYERKFQSRIKNADLLDSRRFIGVGPEYKTLLLAMLLVQPEDGRAHRYIREKLGVGVLGITIPGTSEVSEAVLKLDLRRPLKTSPRFSAAPVKF